MSIFNGLGRALRWLRDRQGKRQYQVADTAGITKAMLSAYETGKQKPSLETLEKILAALDCDLNDLHNALQIVNERPEAIRRPGAVAGEGGWPAFRRGMPDIAESEGAGPDVYRVLGLSRALPPVAEQALGEMLDGFHKFLRYLHARTSPPPPPPVDEGGSAEEPA
jgi:transcriptional regulator with XRE-family HTH domain